MGLEASTLNRIVFTGDCLRSETGEPNQWANVVWLKNLLGTNLGALTGLRLEALLPPPVDAWRALGEKPSLERWARTFWQAADDRLCDYLRPFYDGALVVAIELSPFLEAALDRLGIPWVEVGVSPLRFLPDFALFFRFSAGLRVPERFRLTDDEVQAAVAKVKTFYGIAPVQGTVFFAQTPHDRTQITRTGFVDAPDFVDNLPGPLWVKPHPLSPDNPIIERALKRGARLLDHNTYATLSGPVTVASISSSVVVEAVAFGRNTIVAHSEVLDRNLAGLTTMNGYRHSDFWREALIPLPLTDATFGDPFVPNALRAALHAYGLDMAIYAPSPRP